MRLRQLKRFGRLYRVQAEFIADAWHIRVFRDGHLVKDFPGPTEQEAERNTGALELALDAAAQFVESGCFEHDARDAASAGDEPDETGHTRDRRLTH